MVLCKYCDTVLVDNKCDFCGEDYNVSQSLEPLQENDSNQESDNTSDTETGSFQQHDYSHNSPQQMNDMDTSLNIDAMPHTQPSPDNEPMDADENINVNEENTGNNDAEYDFMSDSKWNCEKCTFLNVISYGICVTCGHERTLDQRQWLCRSCNYVNQEGLRCQVCERPEIIQEHQWICGKCQCVNDGGFKCVKCDYIDESRQKKEPTADMWICSNCSIQSTGLCCSDCGTEGPKCSKWVCEQCSYYNPLLAESCVVCNYKNDHIKLCPKCKKSYINKSISKCNDCYKNFIDRKWVAARTNCEEIVCNKCASCHNKIKHGSYCNICLNAPFYGMKKCSDCQIKYIHKDLLSCFKCAWYNLNQNIRYAMDPRHVCNKCCRNYTNGKLYCTSCYNILNQSQLTCNKCKTNVCPPGRVICSQCQCQPQRLCKIFSKPIDNSSGYCTICSYREDVINPIKYCEVCKKVKVENIQKCCVNCSKSCVDCGTKAVPYNQVRCQNCTSRSLNEARNNANNDSQWTCWDIKCQRRNSNIKDFCDKYGLHKTKTNFSHKYDATRKNFEIVWLCSSCDNINKDKKQRCSTHNCSRKRPTK